MRVVLFFDLPMQSPSELRSYTSFRKFLIKDGFMMLQKSVYCKLVLNQASGEAVMKNVRKFKPQDGLIQMMMITEKQFSKMEYVIGHKISTMLDSTDRLVEL